jgi:hypothetical protein
MTTKGEEEIPAWCGECKHYYVTWDKDFPYGCKAMGFKSRTYPAQEVRNASRMDCQVFEKKAQSRIDEAMCPLNLGSRNLSKEEKL